MGETKKSINDDIKLFYDIYDIISDMDVIIPNEVTINLTVNQDSFINSVEHFRDVDKPKEEFILDLGELKVNIKKGDS